MKKLTALILSLGKTGWFCFSQGNDEAFIFSRFQK